MGFTLEEIARIIQESETGQSPCADVRRTAHRKLEELDQRLKQLRRYRNELARTLRAKASRGPARSTNSSARYPTAGPRALLELDE